MPTTISDLPQEVWDQILGDLWSPPTATGTDRIPLGDFENFRLANREFRLRSSNAFVDRNIRHLRLRLGANPYNIMPGFEDVKDTKEVLRYFGNGRGIFRDNPVYLAIQTIEFLHYRAKPLLAQAPSLDATCLARLRGQLRPFISKAVDVNEIIFTGEAQPTGTPVGGRSSAAIFAVALQTLARKPDHNYRRVSFKNCDIDANPLIIFLEQHARRIDTLHMDRVWLATGQWELILLVLRDRCPALQTLTMKNLYAVGVTTGGWMVPNFAQFTGENPVLPFKTPATLADGTVTTRNEHYHLAGDVMSMKGRTGVRLGVNKLLESYGSFFYNPAYTYEAFSAGGRIV
ncbi:hypothetical protein Slin15195_G119820 [Septoria linicola]|uniref:Uncharacterized protein n=1 Tax=Septoria linicola TaxID=215465 RepID=A0A9Q9B751_9PEZI|nr:hypothetical protein Slin14017_G096810 [Septoria linicola]USW58663.1 hypothetical protein Slin15195_G119820 [Septoria linicola]